MICTVDASLWTPSNNVQPISIWLDASDSNTITLASGISQWDDKSGNNRNAIQGTGTSQPSYTNTLNGKGTSRIAGKWI